MKKWETGERQTALEPLTSGAVFPGSDYGEPQSTTLPCSACGKRESYNLFHIGRSATALTIPHTILIDHAQKVSWSQENSKSSYAACVHQG